MAIMTAQELRLGNKLLFNNQECVIVEVKTNNKVRAEYLRNDTGHKHMSIIDVEFLSPITLTEEWLLKFGFVKYGSTMAIECGGIEIGTIANNKRFYIQIHTSNATLSIQYVHQLQNLYFVLTLEELTLKAS